MHRILVFWILFCEIVLKMVFCLILAVIFYFFQVRIKLNMKCFWEKNERSTVKKILLHRKTNIWSKSGFNLFKAFTVSLILSTCWARVVRYPLITLTQWCFPDWFLCCCVYTVKLLKQIKKTKRTKNSGLASSVSFRPALCSIALSHFPKTSFLWYQN